ncbi:MAG: putative lipid II flippase FtsW [Gammaproteobacteria bacterium]|nr:MAG: putative lipid II flippase FtsW [Gammaproteobacteria bacterium]
MTLAARRLPPLADPRLARLDPVLLGTALALAAIGLVMVASTSMNDLSGQAHPLGRLWRQVGHLLVGTVLGLGVLRLRMAWWERAGVGLLFVALGLLALVFVPGLGHTVNGSTRWLVLGPLRLQASEPARLFLLVYLAGYLVRRAEEVQSQFRGFLKPLAVLSLAALLLLAEPDFGATVVLVATAFAMLWLAGVPWWQFLLILAGAAAALGVLAVASPYRLHRLTAFIDPWADPYGAGFQLTQSLIAIGRGAWFGAGLGESIQKLYYLPEAHTDFVFAILAEETGLVGVTVVIGLFALLVWRAFRVAAAARAADQPFSAWLAGGLGTWLGLQAVINLGVNMGLLPTKGLALPFVSYGGSALVLDCVLVALLARIDLESRESIHAVTARRRPLATGGRGRP